MDLEGIAHMWVSKQRIYPQQKLALRILVLSDRDINLKGILIPIALYAQWSILLFDSQEVIHVVVSLHAGLGHILHV